MNSLIKDLFSVLKSRVTVISCGIITSIVTARYLGPAGSGLLAALTVYPDLFMTFGSLGIRQSTAFFIGKEKYSDKDTYSAVLFVWVFTSLICTLICFLILKYLVKGENDSVLVLLAIIPIPFALFNNYSSGLFLGKNKIKEFNTINWVPTTIKMAGSIVFIVFFTFEVRGALLGIVSSVLIMSFLVFQMVGKTVKIQIKFDRQIIKDLLGLGSVYAFSLLIINLNYKIGVSLLEQFSNKYEVGIYSKGMSVIQYLWEIPTLLSTIIFSRSAISKEPREFSNKVCILLRLCTLIILFLSIIFFFVSDFIMVFMYGAEFLPSALVQKIMIPGVLLLTIFKVLNMDLAGKGKPWIAMKAMIPSLIINIGLNYVLDDKYGANGAAIATTVSYSLAAILFLFFYSRSVNIPIIEIISFKKTDFDFVKPLFQKIKSKFPK